MIAQKMKIVPNFYTSFSVNNQVQDHLEKQFSIMNFVCLFGPPGCGKTYNAQLFCTKQTDAIWVDGIDNYFHSKEIQELRPESLSQMPETIYNSFPDETFFIFDNVSFDEIKFLENSSKKVLLICNTKSFLEQVTSLRSCGLVNIPLFTIDQTIEFLKNYGLNDEKINNFLRFGIVNNTALQRDVRNYSKQGKNFQLEIGKLFQ